MKRMKRWLKNMKLKKKIFLLILIVVMGYMILESWSQQKVYDSYNEKLNELNQKNINIYMNYLDDLFIRMESVTYSMIEDTGLHENILALKDEYNNQKVQVVANRLSNYAKDPYFSAFAFVTEQRIFSFNHALQYKEEVIREYARSVEGARGVQKLVTEDGQLIMLREIIGVGANQFQTIGYVVAWVDLQSIVKDMKESVMEKETSFELAIYDGDICLYSNLEDGLQSGEEGWYIAGDSFLSTYTSSETGFTITLCTDYSDIEHTIRTTHREAIFNSVLISLIVLIVGNVFTGYIVKDMVQLTRRMDEFGQGKLPEKEEEQECCERGDEIGFLYRHFFQMIRDYKRLTEEYYKHQMLFREAKFSYLQKQIQPHFLYNTLSAISWMAISNEDHETADMLKVLSSLMRTITDNKKMIITVEEELKILEDYVTIQRMRFEDNLDVEITISPWIRKLRIPKLTLQPILENSILYAMDSEECLKIHIYDQSTPTGTMIIVEDNGPGFAPIEDLEAENVILETEEESRGEVSAGIGVGLRNIHLRLKYLYPGGGLSFCKTADGMKVIIRIVGKENTQEDKGEADGKEIEAVACR